MLPKACLAASSLGGAIPWQSRESSGSPHPNRDLPRLLDRIYRPGAPRKSLRSREYRAGKIGEPCPFTSKMLKAWEEKVRPASQGISTDLTRAGGASRTFGATRRFCRVKRLHAAILAHVLASRSICDLDYLVDIPIAECDLQSAACPWLSVFRETFLIAEFVISVASCHRGSAESRPIAVSPPSTASHAALFSSRGHAPARLHPDLLATSTPRHETHPVLRLVMSRHNEVNQSGRFFWW